jgi:hypothetical protein
MVVVLSGGNVSKRPALEGVSICVKCRKVSEGEESKMQEKEKVGVLVKRKVRVDCGCPD